MSVETPYIIVKVVIQTNYPQLVVSIVPLNLMASIFGLKHYKSPIRSILSRDGKGKVMDGNWCFIELVIQTPA